LRAGESAAPSASTWKHTKQVQINQECMFTLTFWQAEVDKIRKDRLEEALDVSLGIELTQIYEEEVTHLISEGKKRATDKGDDDDAGPNLMDMQSLVMKAKTSKAALKNARTESAGSSGTSVNRGHDSDLAPAASAGSAGVGAAKGQGHDDDDDDDDDEDENVNEGGERGEESSGLGGDARRPFMPTHMVTTILEAVRCVSFACFASVCT